MKKIYSLILFLSFTLLTYSQGPEFTINFEGANPLTTLPSGVTSVNPQDFFETPESPGVFSDSIVAFIANNSHYFAEEGGDLIRTEVFAQRAQFDNVIKDVDGNKLLQTDYTGHIVIDEAALGTASYTVRLNMSVFGHRMGSTDCGIFTVTGNNAGTYEADFFTSRNGGFASGFGDPGGIGGATGFAYGTATPPYREVVITYNATDMLYRIYIEGVLRITSDAAHPSANWTDRKFYIGFNGRNSVSSTGTNHLNTTTGEFTSNGVRTGDGRVADLQMRMDNIEVYQRAVSDAEVTSLHAGLLLSSNNITKESIGSYNNPVKDILNFSSEEVYSVEVYNALGAKMFSKIVENGVDMSNLNKGVYLVKTQDENGVELGTIKVIKE